MKAFSNRPYPGDDRIADSDRRYPDYEGHRVSAFFRGKDWRAVSFASLRDGYVGDRTATLHFMVDEGFLYYLPAFLLMALEPQAGEMAEALSFALTDGGTEGEEDSRRFHARMARLSAEEKAAVADVLRFLADGYDREGDPVNPARKALRSYWERAEASA
jgi:hypothetical protein